MRRILPAALAALLAASAAGRAGESPLILACRSDLAGWSARLDLREDSSASIVVEKSGKRHVCSLTLTDLDDRPGAVVPRTKLRFTRGTCRPALSATEEKTLHTELPAVLRWTDRRKPPAGSLQWLRANPVSPCRVTALRAEELRRNAGKWKNGLWGAGESGPPSRPASVQ